MKDKMDIGSLIEIVEFAERNNATATTELDALIDMIVEMEEDELDSLPNSIKLTNQINAIAKSVALKLTANF